MKTLRLSGPVPFLVLAIVLALGCSKIWAGGDEAGLGTDAAGSAAADSGGQKDSQCAAACDGMQCGCGGACGECAATEVCTDAGLCKPVCPPICLGKVCGTDGCGGTCGECPGTETCTDAGQCQPTCEPACEDKECGLDWCGGACGTCPDTAACIAGQCKDMTLALGNSCINPFAVDAVPFNAEGDTNVATDKYSLVDESCEGFLMDVGKGSNDHVYAFTPAVTGFYRIQLQSNGWSSVLWVADSCDAPSPECLLVSHTGGTTTSELGLDLDAGTTYFIFVDGDTDFYNLSGPYTLSVSEPYGNTCAAPTSIDTLPFTYSASTEFATDNFSIEDDACNGTNLGKGGGARDHVFELTAPFDGIYSFNLTIGHPGILLVAADCDDVNGTCLGVAETVWGGTPEELLLTLEADQAVTIVVSSTEHGGSYTLTVELCEPLCATDAPCGHDGCGGSCGSCDDGLFCESSGTCVEPGMLTGNTCDVPIVIDTVPFTFEGDTSKATGDIQLTDEACVYWDVSVGTTHNDHVFQFTAPYSATFTFSLKKGSFYQSILYAAASCSAIVDSTCLDVVYKYSNPAVINLPLDEGQTIALVVDAVAEFWGVSATGKYTLSVELCVPVCAWYQDCGNDECGGVCGTCGPSTYCQGGSCEPKPE